MWEYKKLPNSAWLAWQLFIRCERLGRMAQNIANNRP
jgi:hypothetical protein